MPVNGALDRGMIYYKSLKYFSCCNIFLLYFLANNILEVIFVCFRKIKKTENKKDKNISLHFLLCIHYIYFI